MNIARLTSLIIGVLGFGLTVVYGMAIEHRQKRQNYDALLQNKAFVESQINCVLGRGHCDRIGSRIKVLVPEVVQLNECKSCTEDERGNVQKVADHVQNHYPKAWNEIKDQFKDELEEELEDEVEDEEVEVEVNEDEDVDNSVSTESTSTPAPADADTETGDSNAGIKLEENSQETVQDAENQKHQSEEQEEETADTLNQEQEQKVEEAAVEEQKVDASPKKDENENTEVDNARN